ncbi:MAG: DNA repair protein RecO [Clostridia bacterium]|nr:DNA repair protein RecO [Clostridia bacterium]
MEKNFKGIVVSSKDLKEKDKQITLFSVENGLINLNLKGVKNPNAKLKYAKELFTFGEYETIEKNNFFVVKGCEVIDNFYNLSQNAEKYLEACYIIGVIKAISQFYQQDIKLFFDFANALKTLNYDNTQNNIVFCKFLVKIFETSGYKLSVEKCANCGERLTGKKFLILNTGEIVCNVCKTINSFELSNLLHTNLRLLSNTEYEKLHTLKLNTIEECLSFLKTNFKYRFGKEI